MGRSIGADESSPGYFGIESITCCDLCLSTSTAFSTALASWRREGRKSPIWISFSIDWREATVYGILTRLSVIATPLWAD
jgi:hypothetical protein